MKVTFPYMGTTVIYKKLLELLGYDVIVPPRPSKKTIDLGVKYSPEFACFPFKVIMGSYIEAIEAGADLVVTSGGNGPCRAGFYSEVHRRIVEHMGYDVKFVVFDDLRKDIGSFIRNVKLLKGNNSWRKIYESIKITYKMAQHLDGFEKQIERLRAHEKVKGSCNRVWQEITKIYDEELQSYKDLKICEKKSRELIEGIELKDYDKKNAVKIGIVGEIYVVMESSINLNIEELLNSYGVEVERSQYLSEWVDANLNPFKRSREEKILKLGERFMPIIIGGHAKQNMGHIVDFYERGFDGIIHLLPFGCLPELVSQSIIPKIYEKFNIPILSLSLDEQTGEANIITRLEAFLDLVKGKKNIKVKGK